MTDAAYMYVAIEPALPTRPPCKHNSYSLPFLGLETSNNSSSSKTLVRDDPGDDRTNCNLVKSVFSLGWGTAYGSITGARWKTRNGASPSTMIGVQLYVPWYRHQHR